MRKLFAGEWSVAATYWIGFVGFNLFMRAYFFAQAAAVLWLYSNWNETVVDWLIIVPSVLATIYCLFLARGQYRAMHNDRTPSGWSWLGLVLIGLGVGIYAYGAVTVLFGNLPVSRKAIETEISGLRLSLPQEVEEGVTLLDARLQGDVLVYKYSIEGGEAGQEDFSVLEDDVGPETCANFEGYFRGALTDIEFKYLNDAGEKMMTGRLNGKECLDYLSAK